MLIRDGSEVGGGGGVVRNPHISFEGSDDVQLGSKPLMLSFINPTFQ